MLLLLFVCSGISFLLHWHTVSRPTLISGTVINWMTGQPVAGVMVRYKELNGSQEAAWTDTQGRFTATLPEGGRTYLLYAAGPRFGPLLRSTFGHTVVVHTRGEQHSDVIVPAIPATEISGHVYDEGTNPLPGCEVWALTDEPDQALPLHDVDLQHTDQEGTFTFTHLGADRYFVLVRCHKYLPGEHQQYDGASSVPWTIRNSWQPMLFPQAESLNQVKAIVLLPGDRKRGIDFHLRAVTQYSVYGKVILSDRSRPMPWPQVTYFHDLRAFPLDPALAATAPNGEACNWNANTGRFHCDFLSPGAYKLTFSLDFAFGPKGNSLDITPQKAEIQVEVTARRHAGLELTVELQEWKSELLRTPTVPENGFLRLKRVCTSGLGHGWINTFAWGPAKTHLRTFGIANCAEEITWSTTAASYTVSAYQADFFGWRGSSKIRTLLREHGSQVSVRKGSTSYLSVPVWSTDEIIRWALASLRQNRRW